MKVHWDENVCQHAGVCVNSLPAVFRIEDGAFVIDPTAADERQLRDVCATCPSGALTIEEA